MPPRYLNLDDELDLELADALYENLTTDLLLDDLSARELTILSAKLPEGFPKVEWYTYKRVKQNTARSIANGSRNFGICLTSDGVLLSPINLGQHTGDLDWEPEIYAGPIEMSGALPVDESPRGWTLPQKVKDQEPWDSHNDFLTSLDTQPHNLTRGSDLGYLFLEPRIMLRHITGSFCITNQGIMKAIAWASEQCEEDSATRGERDYYVLMGLRLFGGRAPRQKVVYPENLEPFQIKAGVNDQFWLELKQLEPPITSPTFSTDGEDEPDLPIDSIQVTPSAPGLQAEKGAVFSEHAQTPPAVIWSHQRRQESRFKNRPKSTVPRKRKMSNGPRSDEGFVSHRKPGVADSG